MTVVPFDEVVSPRTIRSPVPPLERSLMQPPLPPPGPPPRLLVPLPTLPVLDVRQGACLAGLSTAVDLAGVRGKRRLSQPCRKASSGVIRVSGSQSRHREMKSTKSVSSSDHSAALMPFVAALAALLAVVALYPCPLALRAVAKLR